MNHCQSIFRLRRRPAFTLTEVMISVALMVILLFGINYIFSTSADAISAGQTSNDISRNGRAIQPLMFNDLNNVVKDPPAFIIASRRVSQFLNTADVQNNTGVAITPAYTNAESHRCDIISFFAHGFFRRRTANDTYFSSSTTMDDAFIQYGHAALPANDLSAYYGPDNSPAVLTPPQIVGAYASDWVLARTAILLRDPNYIPKDAGNVNNEIYYAAQATGTPYSSNLTPLSFGAKDSANVHVFGDSRYDLAGVSMEQFRRTVANAYINQRSGTGGLWCAPLLYQTDPTLTAGTYTWAGNPATNRFQCNPILPSPLSSQSIAQMAPYLIQHCSQFVVEFAGDYLSQDNVATDANYSQITGIVGDGQVDYWLDASNNKHIRWYGFPRKTSIGGTTIRGYKSGGEPNQPLVSNAYQDVIPLRDYYSLFSGTQVTTPVGPEVDVNVGFTAAGDYGTTALDPNSRYACAWYNDTPALVRILIKVDDPNDKLKDGPWFEFVFHLK